MRRIILMVTVAAVMVAMMALTSPAFAEHKHYLQTPTTCVEDIAKGQTAISDTEHGGYHRFHENVHTGTPGEPGGAFSQGGQVEVGKSETGACPQG